MALVMEGLWPWLDGPFVGERALCLTWVCYQFWGKELEEAVDRPVRRGAVQAGWPRRGVHGACAWDGAIWQCQVLADLYTCGWESVYVKDGQRWGKGKLKRQRLTTSKEKHSKQ